MIRSIDIFWLEQLVVSTEWPIAKGKMGLEVNDDCMSCEPQYVDKLWFRRAIQRSLEK